MKNNSIFRNFVTLWIEKNEKDVKTFVDKHNYSLQLIYRILNGRQKNIDNDLYLELCEITGYSPEKISQTSVFDSFHREGIVVLKDDKILACDTPAAHILKAENPKDLQGKDIEELIGLREEFFQQWKDLNEKKEYATVEFCEWLLLQYLSDTFLNETGVTVFRIMKRSDAPEMPEFSKEIEALAKEYEYFPEEDKTKVKALFFDIITKLKNQNHPDFI